MPAPTTADELVALVRHSQVAESALLDRILKELPPEELRGDAAAMARALVREGAVTHFQAQQFLQGKSRGFFIGNYKVLERLGTGGMGLVYLCEHRLMRRRVAIKVLPNASAKDAESLKRFYREARVSAALSHPNIVRAFDVDNDDKHHYQVMEFIDGTLLHDLVAKHGPLSVPRAAHYISMAAAGLQHAYENKFVHRDIKPNNLIVDRNGCVKVFDMGLARVFSDAEETLTRGILGTPDYLAPEQAVDSHHVDIRADIYSLGCTMYFLLTGQPPFNEGSVAQKMIKHQKVNPTPIRQLRPDVPQEMAAALEVMMAKDPAARYQTPAEVVEALTTWTDVPIPPPSEEEMPKLSPAATRSALQTATGMSAGANASLGGAARPLTQTGAAAKPVTPPPRPAAALRPVAPSRLPVPSRPAVPPRPAAAVAAVPVPRPVLPIPQFEETPDPLPALPTPSPASRKTQKPVLTVPSAPRVEPPPKPPQPPPAKLRMAVIGLLLLAGAALVGFAISWVVFSR